MRAFWFLLALTVACAEETPANPSDPCDEFACDGHGDCVVFTGSPTCVCDPGYRNDGPRQCVRDGTEGGPAGDPNGGDPNDTGDPNGAGDPLPGDSNAGDPSAGDPATPGDPSGGDLSPGDTAPILELTLTGPARVPVGACARYELSRSDSAGALFISLTGATFYSDPVCAAGTGGITLNDGNRSDAFWLRETAPATRTVTATAAGYPPASMEVVVNDTAQDLAGLAISGPTTIGTDRCTHFSVHTVDTDGWAVLVADEVTVTLGGAGMGAIYSDPLCTSATTTIGVAAATASTSFYFRSQQAETIELSAAATGLQTGTANVTVALVSFTPVRLTISCPLSTPIGICTPCAVTLLAAGNQLAVVATDTNIDVTTGLGDTFADASCGAATSTVTVPSNRGSAVAYLMSTATGTAAVSATGSSLAAANTTLTFVPASFPPAAACSADGDCPSGNCECAGSDCLAHRCSPVDCDCRFNADGDSTCEGYLEEGLADPDLSCGRVERCDGSGGCRASVRLEELGAISTPPFVAPWSSSGYYINGNGGVSVIGVGDWTNTYATYNVAVHVYDDSGNLTSPGSFTVFENNPVLQGFSDEPSFVANYAPDHRIDYIRIDPDTAGTSVTTINVPSVAPVTASDGKPHKRGDDFYYFSYDTDAVYLADVSSPGVVDATLVFDATSLPATLFEIYIGRNEIYGLLTNDTLVTWDRSFNELRSASFTPTQSIFYSSHAGGGLETELYSPEDGLVYVLSWDSLHVIANDVYYFVGTATTGIVGSYGGWGIRGQSLRAYSVSSNELRSYLIHFE